VLPRSANFSVSPRMMMYVARSFFIACSSACVFSEDLLYPQDSSNLEGERSCRHGNRV
jgi:hypothetical protein